MVGRSRRSSAPPRGWVGRQVGAAERWAHHSWERQAGWLHRTGGPHGQQLRGRGVLQPGLSWAGVSTASAAPSDTALRSGGFSRLTQPVDTRSSSAEAAPMAVSGDRASVLWLTRPLHFERLGRGGAAVLSLKTPRPILTPWHEGDPRICHGTVCFSIRTHRCRPHHGLCTPPAVPLWTFVLVSTVLYSRRRDPGPEGFAPRP